MVRGDRANELKTLIDYARVIEFASQIDRVKIIWISFNGVMTAWIHPFQR